VLQIFEKESSEPVKNGVCRNTAEDEHAILSLSRLRYYVNAAECGQELTYNFGGVYKGAARAKCRSMICSSSQIGCPFNLSTQVS
jgi:hypothetical protein